MSKKNSLIDLVLKNTFVAFVGIAQLFWIPAAAQDSGTALGKPQLEQLVAPIALYPDDLLSQVLMASTYPLEVVEAARWARDNKNVTGTALQDAMVTQSWDPSVKSLAAVPQTLQMMSEKLDWTQKLGDAFLAQQKDVLDAVQTLRQRADAAGNLKTTPQQKVSRTARQGSGAGPASVIAIEPVDPDMLYVPVYDPVLAYGAWPYGGYQPFYWYPPGYIAGGVFGFAAGVAVGAAIWGHVDWWRRDVNINVNRFNQFNRTNIANNVWNHNPAHRGGVPYANGNVARKFGNADKAAARESFRNRADTGRRNLSNPSARNTAKNAAARGGAGGQAKIANQARNKQITHTPTGARNKALAQSRNVNRPHTAMRPDISRARAQAFPAAGAGPRVHAGAGARRGGGLRRR